MPLIFLHHWHDRGALGKLRRGFFLALPAGATEWLVVVCCCIIVSAGGKDIGCESDKYGGSLRRLCSGSSTRTVIIPAAAALNPFPKQIMNALAIVDNRSAAPRPSIGLEESEKYT